jgi:hypothetical protein
VGHLEKDTQSGRGRMDVPPLIATPMRSERATAQLKILAIKRLDWARPVAVAYRKDADGWRAHFAPVQRPTGRYLDALACLLHSPADHYVPPCLQLPGFV